MLPHTENDDDDDDDDAAAAALCNPADYREPDHCSASQVACGCVGFCVRETPMKETRRQGDKERTDRHL